MSAVDHYAFSVERRYDAPRGEVFAAWSRPERKATWFVGTEGWTQEVAELEFRVGGREVNSGRYDDGELQSYVATYEDVVPDRRFVCTYALLSGDARLSSSIATVELDDDAAATRLRFTEQGVLYDGSEDAAARQARVERLLDALGDALA